MQSSSLVLPLLLLGLLIGILIALIHADGGIQPTLERFGIEGLVDPVRDPVP